MRVFNIYRFNIADKVKFKDAQSYIQNMLAELGLGWSDLAFAASTVSGDRTISNVLEKLPKLKKYFKSAEDEPMICSYTENWSSGEIFAAQLAFAPSQSIPELMASALTTVWAISS